MALTRGAIAWDAAGRRLRLGGHDGAARLPARSLPGSTALRRFELGRQARAAVAPAGGVSQRDTRSRGAPPRTSEGRSRQRRSSPAPPHAHAGLVGGRRAGDARRLRLAWRPFTPTASAIEATRQTTIAEDQRRVADEQRRIADARREEADANVGAPKTSAGSRSRDSLRRRRAIDCRRGWTWRCSRACKRRSCSDTDEARSSLLAALFYSPHLRDVSLGCTGHPQDGGVQRRRPHADRARPTISGRFDCDPSARPASAHSAEFADVRDIRSLAVSRDASRLALAARGRIVHQKREDRRRAAAICGRASRMGSRQACSRSVPTARRWRVTDPLA